MIAGVALAGTGIVFAAMSVRGTRCHLSPEPELWGAWTLREVASAQQQFAASGHVDADRDGKGEYGGLLEISGSAPARGGNRVVPSPSIGLPFVQVSPDGTAEQGGYRYRMFLAARGGGVVREAPATRFAVDTESPPNPCAGPQRIALDGGFVAASVDTDAAEQMWVCYAWPAAGRSGRTFVVTESGEVFAAAIGAYGGAAGPAPGAALDLGGLDSIDGTPQDGMRAQDGNVWTRLR